MRRLLLALLVAATGCTDDPAPAAESADVGQLPDAATPEALPAVILRWVEVVTPEGSGSVGFDFGNLATVGNCRRYRFDAPEGAGLVDNALGALWFGAPSIVREASMSRTHDLAAKGELVFALVRGADGLRLSRVSLPGAQISDAGRLVSDQTFDEVERFTATAATAEADRLALDGVTLPFTLPVFTERLTLELVDGRLRLYRLDPFRWKGTMGFAVPIEPVLASLASDDPFLDMSSYADSVRNAADLSPLPASPCSHLSSSFTVEGVDGFVVPLEALP